MVYSRSLGAPPFEERLFAAEINEAEQQDEITPRDLLVVAEKIGKHRKDHPHDPLPEDLK